MIGKLILFISLTLPGFAVPHPQMVELEACSYDVAKTYLDRHRQTGAGMHTRPEIKLVLKSIVEKCVNERRLHNGLTGSEVKSLLTAGYLRALEEVFPAK